MVGCFFLDVICFSFPAIVTLSEVSKVTVKLEPALIYSLKVAVIFISPLKLKVPFEDVDEKLDNSGATRSEIITKEEEHYG